MHFKTFLSLAAAFFGAFITVETAANATHPVETPVEVKRILAPSGLSQTKSFVGFDDNDDVLVTVLGILPSTCHRVGSYSHDISGDEITIRQNALEYKGKICIQARVPFANDIHLGVIGKANMKYKIVDGSSKKVIGSLPITVSPVAEPDSELYLNVTDTRLVYEGKTKKWHAVVVGMHNSACTKLKQVKIDILEAERALVIRPILERDVKVADADCEPTERLQHSEPINFDLKGMWLLHVRSVQGAGKHELVDTESYKTP